MKLIRNLILVVSFLSCPMVFATEPIFGTEAETNYARTLPTPAKKALVYIYMRESDSSNITPRVYINNYEVGRLVPGSFTVWQLVPGQLEVRVDGTPPATFSILSEAGKLYLFRIAIVPTATGPQPQLTSLPASYRSDLIGTQMLKNPRQVTAVAAAVAPLQATPAKPAPVPEKQITETKPVEQVKPTATTYHAPGGMALLLKGGALTLATETQTITGDVFTFDDSVSGVFDIEFTYQFASGLSIGGEVISYTSNFTEVGTTDTGQVDTLILTANAKQHFRTDASLQPYVGAGIGIASNDVSGTLTGGTAGLAYHASIGIEYRFDNIGLLAEYKFINAETEDDNGEKMDVSGSGVFAGVAFHF